jgi:hypothetical protein
MLVLLLIVVSLVGAASARAEEAAAANPLATLNAELQSTLAAAGVPFSDDQVKAVALMMEERRRASEELFGNLMDFRSGPTQGQDADRLRSAIDWMRSEFLASLDEYLTSEQAAVWKAHLAASAATAGASSDGAASAAAASDTQYVHINANGFTAEDSDFSGADGSGTEVIQRGGAGAWHGNGQLLFKDDALNARNPFAANKPPYHEHRLDMEISGPVIPGRVTSNISFQHIDEKDATTVLATLPDGVFALGITRPRTAREVQGGSTVQLANAHSLRGSVRYSVDDNRNRGVGGFTLPERASTATFRETNVSVRSFSALTPDTLLETRVLWEGDRNDTVPMDDAVRLNVLGAFNGGGAQNRSSEDSSTLEFGTLFTHVGSAVTLKSGVEGHYRVRRTTNTANFGGTFTFSGLDSYLAGTPLTYKIAQGNPSLSFGQLEAAGFVQADVKLTPRVTLLAGARYEAQQNLHDYNNLAPRVSIAYAPSAATVFRAGTGLFYRRLTNRLVETQRRFDGTRQYELVIDDPAYPDPFAAGTIRQTPLSVRVTDPNLVAPVSVISMVSLERTFFSNLLLTASYDIDRRYHVLRTRNLNAPFDAAADTLRACTASTPETDCITPDPTRGNVLNLESSGRGIRHTLRVSVRERFRLFNVSTSYQYRRQYSDVQGDDGALATDSYDPHADWGNTPNPRHQLDTSVDARLPLGLFITGRMQFNSGRYYTITTGHDDNRDSNVNDRPAGVRPNSERGPHYLNFDFNISKAFFFGQSDGDSGTNANVFLNVRNAFNYTHFGTPSGVLTSRYFGQSTSANDPREIEVGVRFQF